MLKNVARIVGAFVGNNQVPLAELPNLINSVHQAMAVPVIESPAPADILTPAVTVRKSVTDHHIFCLDCGKPLKMLKRHLATEHRLSVDEYRSRWRLGSDYPFVASSYAEHRSALAKAAGLGRQAGLNAEKNDSNRTRRPRRARS